MAEAEALGGGTCTSSFEFKISNIKILPLEVLDLLKVVEL